MAEALCVVIKTVVVLSNCLLAELSDRVRIVIVPRGHDRFRFGISRAVHSLESQSQLIRKGAGFKKEMKTSSEREIEEVKKHNIQEDLCATKVCGGRVRSVSTEAWATTGRLPLCLRRSWRGMRLGSGGIMFAPLGKTKGCGECN